jgi:hypothetical protein
VAPPNTMQVWEYGGEKAVATLKGHRAGVQAIVVDGKHIISASDDYNIKVSLLPPFLNSNFVYFLGLEVGKKLSAVFIQILIFLFPVDPGKTFLVYFPLLS